MCLLLEVLNVRERGRVGRFIKIDVCMSLRIRHVMIFFLPTPRLLIDKLNTHRNIGGFFSPLPLLVRFYKKNVFLYKNAVIR